MEIQYPSLSHMQEPRDEVQGQSYSKDFQKLNRILAFVTALSSLVFLRDGVTNRIVPQYSVLVSLYFW